MKIEGSRYRTKKTLETLNVQLQPAMRPTLLFNSPASLKTALEKFAFQSKEKNAVKRAINQIVIWMRQKNFKYKNYDYKRNSQGSKLSSLQNLFSISDSCYRTLVCRPAKDFQQLIISKISDNEEYKADAACQLFKTYNQCGLWDNNIISHTAYSGQPVVNMRADRLCSSIASSASPVGHVTLALQVVAVHLESPKKAHHTDLCRNILVKAGCHLQAVTTVLPEDSKKWREHIKK